MSTLLAGDVGGTKVNLALFEENSGILKNTVVERFESKKALRLSDLIKQFLSANKATPVWGCLGIPGPVIAGEVKVTNLPWHLTERELSAETGLPGVTLVNDLAATAAAIPFLLPEDIETLHPGESLPIPPPEHRRYAVVAPGTGLGEAFLSIRNGKFEPFSSEGGHTDFKPNDETQDRLMRYLRKVFGHVSLERVLCGPGLVNIYRFLIESEGLKASPQTISAIQTGDPAAAITAAAASGNCDVCKSAMQIFIRVLGAEAGNMVLKFMATGGVYLGGGIPPKIIQFLRSTELIEAYTDKGRLAALISATPLHVITNDRVALIGAAAIAKQSA